MSAVVSLPNTSGEIALSLATRYFIKLLSVQGGLRLHEEIASPAGLRYRRKSVQYSAALHNYAAGFDLDDFAERILLPKARELAAKLPRTMECTVALDIPERGVIAGARHSFDGISLRALVLFDADADDVVVRYDLGFVGY